MPPPRERVLVIEDDADIREAIVEYLQDHGYDVAAAENGVAGLARLTEGPLPRAVVLDSMMPVLDGAGTIARLRANPTWARIPVILSSADAHAHELGADRCLAKPFSACDLAEALQELIREAPPEPRGR